MQDDEIRAAEHSFVDAVRKKLLDRETQALDYSAPSVFPRTVLVGVSGRYPDTRIVGLLSFTNRPDDYYFGFSHRIWGEDDENFRQSIDDEATIFVNWILGQEAPAEVLNVRDGHGITMTVDSGDVLDSASLTDLLFGRDDPTSGK